MREIEHKYAHLIQDLLVLHLTEESLRLVLMLNNGSTLRVAERWRGGTLPRWDAGNSQVYRLMGRAYLAQGDLVADAGGAEPFHRAAARKPPGLVGTGPGLRAGGAAAGGASLPGTGAWLRDGR